MTEGEALVRNPDLLMRWEKGGLLVRELEGGRSVTVSQEVVRLLDRFTQPQNPRVVAAQYADGDVRFVTRSIAQLRRVGLLLSENEAAKRAPLLKTWRGNLASAQYHLASRDIAYLRSRKAIGALLSRRALDEAPLKPFKSYPKAPRSPLGPPGDLPESARSLERVLKARRTVRRFSRQPVKREQLARIVRDTWGQTGWLDAGPLGRLLAKTSPSAGARHPIEAYVIAWNVLGLRPGLYHYDVRGDEFRRLKSGNLRAQAVEAASGQKFVGEAAFVCVMTAVFERTLWKYRLENAYRVIWLDAGHLAQTFCLSATSLGLGPFTTAAIQESILERLISIDGVSEFAVYLCGAGVPAGLSRAKSLPYGGKR